MLSLEVCPERLLTRAIDLSLCKHGELSTLVLSKLFDLRVAAALLATECVARESEDLKALALVLIVELNEVSILRSHAAGRGNISDHQDLALELGHRDLLAINGGDLDVVDGVREGGLGTAEEGHGANCRSLRGCIGGGTACCGHANASECRASCNFVGGGRNLNCALHRGGVTGQNLHRDVG